MKDWYHKLTTELVSDYDNIYIEKLNYKSIHQEAKQYVSKVKKVYYQFGAVKTMLDYKLGWYKGTKLVEVSAKNTSKICNFCGYIKKDLVLDDREWECPVCRLYHNRDINASINILNRGRSQGLASLDEIVESTASASRRSSNSISLYTPSIIYIIQGDI